MTQACYAPCHPEELWLYLLDAVLAAQKQGVIPNFTPHQKKAVKAVVKGLKDAMERDGQRLAKIHYWPRVFDTCVEEWL